MIYFFIYLFLEVVISTNIASLIGGVATFFELIFSAMIGIILLVNFRTTLIKNLQSVSADNLDLRRLQELNLFTVIGAFLLIAPGFLTDIIGVLMQFSVVVSLLV
ncbi:MAG: FxsA family protein, partial [Sulfurimonas sp.]